MCKCSAPNAGKATKTPSPTPAPRPSTGDQFDGSAGSCDRWCAKKGFGAGRLKAGGNCGCAPKPWKASDKVCREHCGSYGHAHPTKKGDICYCDILDGFDGSLSSCSSSCSKEGFLSWAVEAGMCKCSKASGPRPAPRPTPSPRPAPRPRPSGNSFDGSQSSCNRFCAAKGFGKATVKNGMCLCAPSPASDDDNDDDADDDDDDDDTDDKEKFDGSAASCDRWCTKEGYGKGTVKGKHCSCAPAPVDINIRITPSPTPSGGAPKGSGKKTPAPFPSTSEAMCKLQCGIRGFNNPSLKGGLCHCA